MAGCFYPVISCAQSELMKEMMALGDEIVQELQQTSRDA